MKNPNKITNYKKAVKALAAASALAIAATGIGATEASASSAASHKPAISAEATTLKALTGVVANLENGGQAKVAAHAIEIAGATGAATGQPIVFESKGQTYFAYTQEYGPNFDQKRPADVAGDMAIVKEPITDVSMSLEEAHLDKKGILVDENEIGVGYSVGGESGK
jgi:hypothetical protein